VIAGPAFREFGEVGYPSALTIAVYVGMLAGALFWGLGADIIGRRHAFNISLMICSISAIIAGGMVNWASLGLFVALIGFGGGGNLILDTTVFLEYLPSDKQWAVTLLAAWWGLGQAVTGFIAWGFLGAAS
jgi:MFS family permease